MKISVEKKQDLLKPKPSVIKRGIGNQSNSSNWSAAYIEKFDKYYAYLHFSGRGGCAESIHIISADTYERLGNFENDDYKSERLIREGKCIYKFANEINYIEPLELVYDKKWREIMDFLTSDNK